MRPVLVAASMLMLLAAAPPADAARKRLLAPTSACAPQTDRSAPVADQERAMRCMINYARRAAGVRPLLGADDHLAGAAARKAADILNCQDFSHTACGRPFDYRIRQSGYTAGAAGYVIGENLAWGSGSYGSVREVMTGWLDSAGHRENILDRRYRDHGIALRTGTLDGFPGSAVWVDQLGGRG